MLADLKFPLRKLRRSPGRTATAVLSFAIVAGTSAAGSVRHPCADASVTRLDGMSISATRIDALVTDWMRTAHVTGVASPLWTVGNWLISKPTERGIQRGILLSRPTRS